MPVIAHAQHHDVEGLRHRTDPAPGTCSAHGGRGRIVLQTSEPRCGRALTQQRGAHQGLVAGRITERHPALIGHRDLHTPPIDALLRQVREHRGRCAAARDHETGVRSACERRGQVSGNRRRQHEGLRFAVGGAQYPRFRFRRARHSRRDRSARWPQPAPNCPRRRFWVDCRCAPSRRGSDRSSSRRCRVRRDA